MAAAGDETVILIAVEFDVVSYCIWIFCLALAEVVTADVDVGVAVAGGAVVDVAVDMAVAAVMATLADGIAVADVVVVNPHHWYCSDNYNTRWGL